MIRSSEEVITDIKSLVAAKGYIYSLCLILFEDFHVDLNELHKQDPRSKLSVKECSLLLGFLVKNKLDFTKPDTPEKVLTLKKKTYELMRELQLSYNTSQVQKLREIMERQMNGEKFVDNLEDRIDFFVKDKGMVEPMFYAGDGVYDFQYLEYLQKKYKYDREWLLERRDFDIDEASKIVNSIKQILQVKSMKVNLLDLKERVPQLIKKAHKGLTKQLGKEKVEEIERQQLTIATFYQYKELFPYPKNLEDDNSEGWNTFYENLLDLFIVNTSEIREVDKESVQSFFRNFSFEADCNPCYQGPGYYNVLNSRPLVKLEDDRYFAPIGYLIPEAVYESPFYWMWDDKEYRNTLARNRGKVGEEIAYDFLVEIFGRENTFKSVVVETKKGQRDTDIDVLCLLGNKALCVQVKSKKLTLTAKRGDFDQLSKDFNGAIQDAYNQGLVSRSAILKNTARFIDENGKEIYIPADIDEVYILGLTTENYPSLAHQVHMMLDKKQEDPYPLFLSAFDLELLAHYLKDPYDFLYYVRQRVNTMGYWVADEELVYLGYHLHRKLAKMDGYDGGSLDSSFGALIDRNYYPIKTGMAHLLPQKDDPIHNRWRDPAFELLVAEIKQTGHTKATNIIFNLMDWSGDSRKDIVAQMIKYKRDSRQSKEIKSIATSTPPNFGLSYVSVYDPDPSELEFRASAYAEVRKYVSKCDAWLGMGAFAGSRNLFNYLIYIDQPWKQDVEFENNNRELISKMKNSTYVPLKNRKKVSRNDPCPCSSGKKFKQCCGKDKF